MIPAASIEDMNFDSGLHVHNASILKAVGSADLGALIKVPVAVLSPSSTVLILFSQVQQFTRFTSKTSKLQVVMF